MYIYMYMYNYDCVCLRIWASFLPLSATVLLIYYNVDCMQGSDGSMSTVSEVSYMYTVHVHVHCTCTCTVYMM